MFKITKIVFEVGLALLLMPLLIFFGGWGLIWFFANLNSIIFTVMLGCLLLMMAFYLALFLLNVLLGLRGLPATKIEEVQQ